MSFFSRSKGELSVIFDIGPQNIGAALVLKKDADKPHIIWTHREDFMDEKNKSPRELLEAMLSALKKTNSILQKDAMSELHLKDFSISSSIYCVLSSPWVEVEQKTTRLTYQKPTTITQKITNDILSQEERSFESSFKISQTFSLIEKTVTGFKLNGYSVKDPYDKKASSLEVSFAMAITPKEVIDRIEESISSKKIVTVAYTTTMYRALKELFKEKDFISVTVEDNLTEIALVRDDVPILHASVPLGNDTLVREVSKTLNVPFAEGYSLIRMSFKKETDKATLDKVVPTIKKERDAWHRGLRTSIEDMARQVVLPRKAFFVVSDIGVVLVAHMLKNQNVPEFGISEARFEAITINPSSLKDKLIFNDVAHADARLGLIAIALPCHTEAKR